MLTVKPVEGRRGMRDWLRLPALIYGDDPAWTPLPELIERRRVSKRHAPFFSFGEAQLFLACRDGLPVGRISAQVNRRHLELHRDGTGHFGFFDCMDEPGAARALVGAAQAWLAARGLARMVGPVSFSLNEEAGCLVDGFDTPPAIMMPHHRPWTGRLMEEAGLAKEIDLLAFRAAHWRPPEQMRRIAASARASGIATRRIDMAEYKREFRLAFDICADAWRDNWGFVPFSDAEIAGLMSELRPIMRPDYLHFLTLDGREVGFMLVVPNANEVVSSMRPSGLGWLDLLRTYLRLRQKGTRSYRVVLMGIRREFQASRLGGALMAALFRQLVALHEQYRPEWTEMSWVLETNRPMVRMAELISGPPVKRYRIYSKVI